MQSFLYKALGTALGACKGVLHIQEKLLQHLEETNAEEPSKAQMELDSTRAHATRSSLILAHGSLALRASKEQLLACLEGDIMGDILLLYSCSCRDLLKKYYLGIPVSQVPLRVVLALEQLR
ncbi:maestro heat-like repeat-containing protein family member 2B [Gallus gallus]|uniref:maestro heat-like repeat-containing protein family member 2B n=1 Tax=Gallus gallus TaxID=9031 RepID=UPI001AE3824C|nr:maestro heat-like repeat-containing protein family member 2B [Gallus gallus]